MRFPPFAGKSSVVAACFALIIIQRQQAIIKYEEVGLMTSGND